MLDLYTVESTGRIFTFLFENSTLGTSVKVRGSSAHIVGIRELVVVIGLWIPIALLHREIVSVLESWFVFGLAPWFAPTL